MGPQLVTNGNFNTDLSGWTTTGWTWANGKAVCTTDSNLTQALAIEANKTYLVQFEFTVPNTNYSIAVDLGNQEKVVDGNTSSPVNLFFTTTQDDVNEGGELIFSIEHGVGLEGTTVDNVSVQEYQGNPLKIVQMVGSNPSYVQGINVGNSDNGLPISFELQTQEIEFDNRAHQKKISDNAVILTENGIDSSLECQQNDGDFKPIPVLLQNLVNIGEDINLEGNFFTFKWSGTANETSPIFHGIYLEKVTDQGIVNG